MRRLHLYPLRVLLAGFLALLLASAAEARGDFNSFVTELWPDAQAAGVSRKTFDEAFRGVTADPKVIAQTKGQAEFSRPIWAYVDSAVGGTRVSRGRAQASQWSDTIAAVESRYGVDRRAFIGIWGMETSYGSFFGGNYVVRALASLAYVRYRDNFFRDELIVALQILEEGHIGREGMKGSWAGAMGHTQFMPSSFMKWAVDYDRDGSKDIWDSVPDALASTANYLKEHGWQSGLPWGVEVEVPSDLDLRKTLGRKSFADFQSLGLTRADGGTMPRRGEATLFMPAGSHGPAFLVTENFKVIKTYNSSDAYALGVALLGDLIFGGEGLQKPWPKNEKQLSHEQRKKVQMLLTQQGYYKGKVDGRFGEQSREAVANYQMRNNLQPDGYPTPALLTHMSRNGR